jgi:hypothetical protein
MDTLAEASKSEGAYLKGLRKVRLYADEGIEEQVVSMIKDRGVNIASVH